MVRRKRIHEEWTQRQRPAERLRLVDVLLPLLTLAIVILQNSKGCVAISTARRPVSRLTTFVRPSLATRYDRERLSLSRRRTGRNFLAKSKGEDVKRDDAADRPSQEDLLVDLERRFDYEGRIPSKTAAGGAAAGPSDETLPVAANTPHRCGFVSIIGAPNMGKSTLLNALLDEPLAVATPRPQTTRHAILGVLTTPRVQLCFTDTPGIIDDPAYKLQEGMMEMVRGALRDADVLLVVTDMFSTPIPDDDVLVRLQRTDKPILVCVNKIDLVEKVSKRNDSADGDDGPAKTITPEDAVSRWRSYLPKALAIIPASASWGTTDPGVAALRSILTAVEEGVDVSAAMRSLGRPAPGMFLPGVKILTNDMARDVVPIGPPLYGEDTLTDRSERFCASEIVRSVLFEKLGKELPYCCEVRIISFDESKRDDAKNQLIKIGAVIMVERDSQKGIVVGKGGQMVKDVGMDARKKLEEFFGTKIFLDLEVKVDKDWRKDETKLKRYGYLKK